MLLYTRAHTHFQSICTLALWPPICHPAKIPVTLVSSGWWVVLYRRIQVTEQSTRGEILV